MKYSIVLSIFLSAGMAHAHGGFARTDLFRISVSFPSIDTVRGEITGETAETLPARAQFACNRWTLDERQFLVAELERKVKLGEIRRKMWNATHNDQRYTRFKRALENITTHCDLGESE